MKIIITLTKDDIKCHVLGTHLVIDTGMFQINLSEEAIEELGNDIAAAKEAIKAQDRFTGKDFHGNPIDDTLPKWPFDDDAAYKEALKSNQ